jgi:hypothetical protein
VVAIVVGGLMVAFGEGAAKRTLAGVIFGVGMAVGRSNFMAWLFSVTFAWARGKRKAAGSKNPVTRI